MSTWLLNQSWTRYVKNAPISSFHAEVWKHEGSQDVSGLSTEIWPSCVFLSQEMDSHLAVVIKTYYFIFHHISPPWISEIPVPIFARICWAPAIRKILTTSKWWGRPSTHLRVAWHWRSTTRRSPRLGWVWNPCLTQGNWHSVCRMCSLILVFLGLGN